MEAEDIQNLVGQILLFLVVGLFSGSCEIEHAKKLNKRAVIPGLVSQFLLMPFIGWVVVKMFNPEPIIGVFVLMLTSSPGGAFSNWWCSVFNADLTLSVLLTTCSSLACLGMLPLNLLLYVKTTYGRTVSINWGQLMITIGIVVFAVAAGLSFRYWKRTEDWVPKYFTRCGTVCGIALILFSALVTNNRSDAPVWGNPWHFYASVMTPCFFGFLVGLCVASLPCLDLPMPSRVAIAVETCYQNVGIALAAALTIFEGSDSAWGVRASLLYGLTITIVLAICLVICWKLGWTLAPPSDPILKVMFTEYQHRFQTLDDAATRLESDEGMELGSVDNSATMLIAGEEPSSPLAEAQESDGAVSRLPSSKVVSEQSAANTAPAPPLRADMVHKNGENDM